MIINKYFLPFVSFPLISFSFWDPFHVGARVPSQGPERQLHGRMVEPRGVHLAAAEVVLLGQVQILQKAFFPFQILSKSSLKLI